jgi:methionine-rich copper-binding protein CopC
MNFTSARKLTKARLALSLFVLVLLMVAPHAFAYTHPEMMMPAADATVSAPASIMIHFSGALEPKFSSITVTDATGRVVNKEPSVVGADAKVMTLPLPTLVPGVYTVNWVGVSVDTHRSQGDYKFTVK